MKTFSSDCFQANKELWELKDELVENVKTADLKKMLEANGMEVKKVTPTRIIHKVISGSSMKLIFIIKCADGMIYGNIGNCPGTFYSKLQHPQSFFRMQQRWNSSLEWL